jgi:hypothetical protein
LVDTVEIKKMLRLGGGRREEGGGGRRREEEGRAGERTGRLSGVSWDVAWRVSSVRQTSEDPCGGKKGGDEMLLGKEVRPASEGKLDVLLSPAAGLCPAMPAEAWGWA